MSQDQVTLRDQDSELPGRVLRALPGCIGNFAAASLMALLFARWMGVTEFGIFAFSYHVIRILTLISGLGFNQAALRLIPRYQKAREFGAVNGFVLGTCLATASLGVTTGLTVYLIAIAAKDTHAHEALIHAIWLVPLIAVGLLLSGVLLAHGRVFMGTMAKGSMRDVVALVIAFLVASGGDSIQAEEGLIALGCAMVFAVLLQLADLWISGSLTRAKPVFNGRAWLDTSLPMSVGAIARLLATGSDVILLNILMGWKEAGLYHAAMVLVMLVIIPTRAALAGATPLLSRHADPDTVGKFRHIASQAMRFSVIGSVLMFAVLVVGGHQILALFGPDFTEMYPVLVVLGVATVGYSISLVAGSNLYMLGEAKRASRVIVIGAISTVVMSAIGIISFGMMGAAVAYLINRFGIAIVLVVMTRRQLNVLSQTPTT